MLSSKQKAKLKGIAMTQPSIFQIGKGSINENLVEGLNSALKSKELIKVTLLKTSGDDPLAIAKELEQLTESTLVEVKGKTAVFYKKSDKEIIELD